MLILNRILFKWMIARKLYYIVSLNGSIRLNRVSLLFCHQVKEQLTRILWYYKLLYFYQIFAQKENFVIVLLLFTTLKEEAANSAPNLAQVLISRHLKLYCLVLALVTIFTGDDINNTTLSSSQFNEFLWAIVAIQGTWRSFQCHVQCFF